MNTSSDLQLKHVGKVMDAHGIKGDLYCLIFSGDVSWIKKMKSIYFVKAGKPEEFQIKRIKEFKRGFIATLSGFDNRNFAENYKGAELWVSADVFVSKSGEIPYLSEILGFEVRDEHLGSIGSVLSFSSNGGQDLLILNYKNTEIEIPFVKQFVTEMDFKNKILKTSLPEGLVEINLENSQNTNDEN